MRRFPVAVIARFAVWGGSCALLCAAGMAPFAYTHVKREAQLECGRDLRREYGPLSSVAVTYGATRVGYAALRTMPQIVDSAKPLSLQLGSHRPDLIILAGHRPCPDWRAFAATEGYTLVASPDAEGRRGRAHDLLVLHRHSSAPLSVTSR